jgi:hypothetical protein
VQTIGGELVGCDVLADLAVVRAVGNQLLDEIVKVVPRLDEGLITM